MKKGISALAQELVLAEDRLSDITHYIAGLPQAANSLRVRVDLDWASSSCPGGHKAVRFALERRFNTALREEIAAVQAEARHAVTEAQNALVAAVTADAKARELRQIAGDAPGVK